MTEGGPTVPSGPVEAQLRELLADTLGFQREAGLVTVEVARLVAVVRAYGRAVAATHLRAAATEESTPAALVARAVGLEELAAVDL